MGRVTLQLGGRSYDIHCADGQEAHLRRLAEMVETRLRDLAKVVKPVDSRLLAMTSLQLADELLEARKEQQPAFSPTNPVDSSPVDFSPVNFSGDELNIPIKNLEKLIDRIQALSLQLEQD